MSQNICPTHCSSCSFCRRQVAAQSDDAAGRSREPIRSTTSGKHEPSQRAVSEYLENGYRLADYSLYYLAFIAFKESNWEQSRRYLLQLQQRFPQSVWQARATLQRAKLDQAEKKFAQADEILRQLRTDKSVPREIADEASYLIAQNQEAIGDLPRAYSITRNYATTAQLRAGPASAQGSGSPARKVSRAVRIERPHSSSRRSRPLGARTPIERCRSALQKNFGQRH